MNTNLEKLNELYNTVISLDNIYNKWAKKYKISKNEVCTLNILLQNVNNKITQRQICEQIGTPFTTLNSTIKNLEEKEYIKLEVNENNKKEKYIILTPKGEGYSKNIIEPLLEIEEKTASTLNVKDIEKAISCLSKYRDTISKYMDE